MAGAYQLPQKAFFSGTRPSQTGKASKPVLWSVSRDCTDESKVQRERAVAFQRRPGRPRPFLYPAGLSPAPLPSLISSRRRTAKIRSGPTILRGDKIYRCASCKTHLCTHDEIISRNLRGQHGKAYLFNTVVNVEHAEPQERNMTTGRHVVRDVSYQKCKQVVGWDFVKAYESAEKYKEGKTAIEAELIECQT